MLLHVISWSCCYIITSEQMDHHVLTKCQLFPNPFIYEDIYPQNQKPIFSLLTVALFTRLDCFGVSWGDVCLLFNVKELDGTWLVAFRASINTSEKKENSTSMSLSRNHDPVSREIHRPPSNGLTASERLVYSWLRGSLTEPT